MPGSVISAFIVVAAYLLGSLSGSLLLGRRRGVDIRTQGSGNAGGTNAFRTQGAAFGLGVVLIDIGKGMLAAWLARTLAPTGSVFDPAAHGYAAVIAAMLGHVWPLWHGFRGGKGAAPLVGGLFVVWPWITPVVFVAWLATILLSGYVGLATVLAGATLPLLAWLTGASPARWCFVVAAMLLLVYTHRGNLQRLRAGNEARFERARLLHRIRRGQA